jgi:hypothetical protein
MRALNLIGTVALVVAFAGCDVSSINPLASHDVLQENPLLLGNWVFDISHNGVPLSIVRDDTGGYEISPLQRNHDSTVYAAKLIRLGEHSFIDAVTTKPMGFDAVPIHHILRVDIKRNSLTLSGTDPDKIEEVLRNEPAFPVARIQGKSKRLVLTGSTDELQADFRQYGDQLFGSSISLHRVAE